MSDVPKPVIVLIVVAVLAFVAILVVGDDRVGSADPDDQSWVELFELGGAPTIGADDIADAPPCLDRTTLRMTIDAALSISCTVPLEESDDRARVLDLAVVSGQLEVELTRPFPEEVEVSDVELEEGETFSAAVAEPGGALVVRCGAASCVLDIGS